MLVHRLYCLRPKFFCYDKSHRSGCIQRMHMTNPYEPPSTNNRSDSCLPVKRWPALGLVFLIGTVVLDAILTSSFPWLASTYGRFTPLVMACMFSVNVSLVFWHGIHAKIVLPTLRNQIPRQRLLFRYLGVLNLACLFACVGVLSFLKTRFVVLSIGNAFTAMLVIALILSIPMLLIVFFKGSDTQA
jgi:hypothetical protein